MTSARRTLGSGRPWAATSWAQWSVPCGGDRHHGVATLEEGVTSACSAACADAQHGGGILQGRGRGFQHSLHVLMLGSILGIAQALGLARGRRGTAGELARLQEQGGLGREVTKSQLELRKPLVEESHLFSVFCLRAFCKQVSDGQSMRGQWTNDKASAYPGSSLIRKRSLGPRRTTPIPPGSGSPSSLQIPSAGASKGQKTSTLGKIQKPNLFLTPQPW